MFWFLETECLWKELEGLTHVTENTRHVIQPVELFIEEHEKKIFVFHMNKKSLSCVALFHQESSENVVLALVLFREHHCWNNV